MCQSHRPWRFYGTSQSVKRTATDQFRRANRGSFGVRERNGHVASWSLVSREFLLISARILVSLGYATAVQRRQLTLPHSTVSKIQLSFDRCSLVGHVPRIVLPIFVPWSSLWPVCLFDSDYFWTIIPTPIALDGKIEKIGKYFKNLRCPMSGL